MKYARLEVEKNFQIKDIAEIERDIYFSRENAE
jgi:hypothetical protein